MMTTSVSSVGLCFTVAAIASATFFPAAAHAEESRLTFSSPSGNIHCVISAEDGSPELALCQLDEITYQVPPGVGREENGEPCAGNSGSGNDFRLDVGEPGFIRCSYTALGGGVGPWPTLAYGDSVSLGAITCESEPSAVTCTDTSTGHFFQISRDFYQLG